MIQPIPNFGDESTTTNQVMMQLYEPVTVDMSTMKMNTHNGMIVPLLITNNGL